MIGIKLNDYLSEDQLLNFVKSVSPALIKRICRTGSEQYNNFLVNTEIVFKEYITANYKKHSQIKTLLYRDKPVSLKKHYVKTSFTCNNKKIITSDTFDFCKNSKNNVILGTAGAGKSIFMKRFFIDLIENESGFIPILVELRLLKKDKKYFSIYNYIFQYLQKLNKNFTKKQLNYALKNGKLALLLDGFDEIEESQKSKVENEILDLSYKYDKNIFIITSRPDRIFESWESFQILRTNNLEKKEAIELISKIDYDEELKNNFIADLEHTLFTKHIDFTSNPLLLTMMLLTYEQHAKIPEKMHIFYAEAFNTLFNKHDALKQQFRRKTHTGLPIDEFKKVFSTFCILSFMSNDYTFSKEKLLEYIQKSLDFVSVNIPKEAFLKDLVHTVCVVMRDGNHYTFSHRSFQEYFAAIFISNNSHWEDIYQIIDTVFYKILSSNVINLLFDLNNNIFEKVFFIKKLEYMNSELKKIDIKNNPYNYIQCFQTDFVLKIKNNNRLEYVPSVRYPIIRNFDADNIENVFKKVFAIELYAISELYDNKVINLFTDSIKKHINAKELIKTIFNKVSFDHIKNNKEEYTICFRTETFRKKKNEALNDYLKQNQNFIDELIHFNTELEKIGHRIQSTCKFKQSNIIDLFNKKNI